MLEVTRNVHTDFYPRSPCGERRLLMCFWPFGRLFLSTLSLRRATYDTYAKVLRVNISIHALLAESDEQPGNQRVQSTEFLSTLSLRRATGRHRGNNGSPVHFYPRSPCGERRDVIAEITEAQSISIHALLAESDIVHALKLADTMLFLSTLSLRRATSQQPDGTTKTTYFYPRSPCGERQRAHSLPHAPPEISIHALLAESDEFRKLLYPGSTNFYPRSPCGERLVHALKLADTMLFLSTLSLRRATGCGQYCIRAREISIHALLAESDRACTMTITICTVFLSTLSLRRATIKAKHPQNITYFYPRSPCGERQHPKYPIEYH